MRAQLLVFWGFSLLYFVSAFAEGYEEVFGSELYITISPIASYKKVGIQNRTILMDRRIVLNWHALKVENGSTVGLFNKDPRKISTKWSSAALYFIVLKQGEKQGQAVTPIRLPKGQSWNGCTGFWISHYNQNKIHEANCFRTFPTWQNDIKERIGMKPLHSLMIPGTHNSGAWHEYNGEASESVFYNYAMCQDDSVYLQLNHGIRYLDLRVGHYPDTPEKFWINHDMFRIRPLGEILADVKRFVRETKEVVFLDFHRFPIGFNSSVHKDFVKVVETTFKNMMAPKTFTANTTLDTLWRRNLSLVVAYADTESQLLSPYLWPPFSQEWANTNQEKKLRAYLEKSIPKNACKPRFWAAMVQLTATIEDVLFRPEFGVRGFANITSAKVTTWYLNNQWYTKSMVVTSDYYLGTNFIEMSIKANKNGLVCSR